MPALKLRQHIAHRRPLFLSVFSIVLSPISIYRRLLYPSPFGLSCTVVAGCSTLIGRPKRVHHLFAAGIQFAARTGFGAADSIGGDQRESDGGVGVDNHRLLQLLRLDLAPRDRLGRRRAGSPPQAAGVLW